MQISQDLVAGNHIFLDLASQITYRRKSLIRPDHFYELDLKDLTVNIFVEIKYVHLHMDRFIFRINSRTASDITNAVVDFIKEDDLYRINPGRRNNLMMRIDICRRKTKQSSQPRALNYRA